MRQAAPGCVAAWGLPFGFGSASSCLQEVCGDDVGVGWLRRRRKMPILGAFLCVPRKVQALSILLSRRFEEAPASLQASSQRAL